MEWAGAFGDLGTLIPFAIAYITLLDIDPVGLLMVMGLSQIIIGFYYRTPFPVQPMKALGAVATTQAAQTLTLTPNTVFAAGLVTGVVWLLLGITGMATRLARIVARPVALGIILGLGIAFMLNGTERMSENWILGAIGLTTTLVLLASKRLPAMVVLLGLGTAVALYQDPQLIDQFRTIEINVQLPAFSWAGLSFNDIVVGTLFLALPQMPLTLGNAVIAIKEENNRLFPDRPVSEDKVAVSTGVMNIFSSMFSGIPMCHGAGGMAGHVRFGATTGGATIIIGAVLLVTGLFLGDSVVWLFNIVPIPILGVILFFTGAQLALGAWDEGLSRSQRFVLYTVAAITIWNVGIAFVYGTLVHWLMARNIIKL